MRIRETSPRAIIALLGLALSIVLAGCGSGTGQDDKAGADSQNSAQCDWPQTNLSIGGGATGGSYFLLGATLEKLIDQDVPCADATTAAGTTSEFARGKKDLYFTQPDAAYAAWSGKGGQAFKVGEKFEDTRAMAVGYPNSFAMITKASNPAKTVADLKPTDVVGTSGSTLVDVLKKLFSLHGVNPKITVITSYDQMMTALRQGQIQYVQYGAAYPSPALVEAQESQELKVVAYDHAALLEFQKSYPDYEVVSIPKGTYKFMANDYEVWARRTFLVGQAGLDDELVAEIAKLFYERTDQFVAAVPMAKDFTLPTLQTALDAGTIRVPFHPGARKYFESKGIKFPADLPTG